ncbi:uncharacterized protein LY89DRAFT_762652 [Mollisia scopiformis]|uniref:Uncharacterized protein n=1 Tax=Mollisia scopiformis TaxID=149040 RepID=A0A194XRU5_MOLSC|nr:uncharacterized protein LY89DRAFT_762652 [Mollisia scopiformis]KUJ22447.1 hypothetical protein LY89DRAFT_762652 [Mollisia scopiformis]
MRYQNWDVLVFPDPSKIPLQEFKTSCQVIQDPESNNLQFNPQLLPTITSFIPGLPAGTPFRVSIHCWQNPEISRVLKDLRKPSDIVLFEARLFIDGKMAASKWFGQNGPWPTVIDLSIDLDKHGDFERLKFPAFHRELLSQSYWNPADDLGRLKIVISEGFSREGLTYPFERIKNIISFSFQHAPLAYADVLEASSIAWPNSSMWRQVSIMGPYLAQQLSPRREVDGVEAHSHSPRQNTATRAPFPPPGVPFPPPGFGSMQPPNPPLFQRQPAFDPFTDRSESMPPSFTHWRQRSSADVSMPDYATTRGSSSRQVSDPMQGTEATNPVFETEQNPGIYESLIEAMGPKAPSNTPKTGAGTPVTAPTTANAAVSRKSSTSGAGDRVDSDSIERNLRAALGTALMAAKSAPDSEGQTPTLTLKPIAISGIKGRKENMQDSPLGPEPNATANENGVRVVSQTFVTTNSAGTKRSRVVTPASAKVIDDEDEPRTSPSLRKASRGSVKQDDKENERRVYSGVETIST